MIFLYFGVKGLLYVVIVEFGVDRIVVNVIYSYINI